MFRSLQTRMILFFSALLLLTGLSLSYVIYTSSENLIVKSMGEQARTVAASAVKLIDPARYKEITPENGENDYYNELRSRMNELRETSGLKYLYTMAERSQDGAAEYYYVVDGAPADVSEDDFSPLGEVETEHYESMIRAFETKRDQVGELSADSYGATITAYVPIVGQDGRLLGVMGADFDATAIYAQLDQNRSRLLWITIAIIAAALLFVAGFTRYIVGPLRRIANEMQRVQNGDLTARLSAGGKDEIGRLAGGFSRMAADLNAVIAGIKGSADGVRQSARTMSAGMELSAELGGQIKLHLEQAAAGAEAQRSAAAETSRAMEEVGVGVQRVAEASSVVAEASRSATDLARGGGESIGRIARQMQSIQSSARQVADDIGHLSARSSEIGQIVDTISGIAGQTNLLALNAAIEAAHAGEQGRGFAVVADQIRKLAIQSETSTGQISALLEAMLLYTGKAEQASQAESREVELGLNVVQEAGEAFLHIGKEVQLVADQVQELSAISEQIAAAAEEVTASVDEIARMSDMTSERTTGIASAAQEQAASAAETNRSLDNLNVKAAELEKLVERFRV